MASNPSPQLSILENTLQKEFLNTLEQKEQLRFMKFRINWLTLVDKNNSFFHTSTITRRRRNKILSLEMDDDTTTH